MIRRREFITLIGGAAAFPLVARAQSEVPVIGFLSSLSSDYASYIAAAFRQGVTKTGFAEGPGVKYVSGATCLIIALISASKYLTEYGGHF